MWPTFWKPLVIVIPSAAIVLAVLYMTYHFIDPIPPRHFVIAAGMAGSGYDNFARQYAGILARDGVDLGGRNAAGAEEDLNLLRDGAFGVQAALTALGFTRTGDADTLYSIGGVFDAPIFIFYRNAEPITQFAQFQGKRLSIGTPGTALRSLILQVPTQRQVRADLIVVRSIRRENLPQVRFAEDQHPVQALATHRANQTLYIRVLPRRSRRDRSVADAHRPHPGREGMSVGTVVVTHQVGGS